MNFIHYHVADSGQLRLSLQATQEDSRGAVQQACDRALPGDRNSHNTSVSASREDSRGAVQQACDGALPGDRNSHNTSVSASREDSHGAVQQACDGALPGDRSSHNAPVSASRERFWLRTIHNNATDTYSNLQLSHTEEIPTLSMGNQQQKKNDVHFVEMPHTADKSTQAES